MAGIGLGLRFNLADWRRGIGRAGDVVRKELGGEKTFNPFKKAAARAALSMKKSFDGPLSAIGGKLDALRGNFLAWIAAGAGIYGVARAIWSSAQAAYDHEDAVVRLRAALNTLGKSVNIEAAEKQVEVLGTKLQQALGIARTETVDTFANFVTRGFDTRQAQQLTILAANYARKTGKPLEDVQRKIADAANGNVDAIKELGVQVASTGNKVLDAQNAILALKAAYGETGAELTNPTDRLQAAIGDLQLALGERLLPLFSPLIDFTADFVNGLLKSEEGRVILDGIASSLRDGIEFAKGFAQGVSNFVEVAKSGVKILVAFVKLAAVDTIQRLVELWNSSPISKLVEKGLGVEGLGAEFTKSLNDYSAKATADIREASSTFMMSQNALLRGDNSAGVASTVQSLAEKGRAMREQATSELTGEIASTRNETFAGQVAKDTEREKAKKALEARAKSSGWDAEGSLVVDMRAQITTRGRDQFATYDVGSGIGE